MGSNDYALDVELDFADLPHVAFPARRLNRMMRTLSMISNKRRNAHRSVFLCAAEAQSWWVITFD